MNSKAGISIDRTQSVLFFDGICNLCSLSVRIIHRLDKRNNIAFYPLQSPQAEEIFQSLSLHAAEYDSIIFLSDSKIYIKSDAVLHILRICGGFWGIFYHLHRIPKWLRDSIYDFIAKNRYRIFGKRNACTLSPHIKNMHCTVKKLKQ
jgi:predicted DCC family thiol-disulfide oxidoreductase YuxK